MATQKEIELGKKIVNETTQRILFRTLKYGGDEKNFRILESLPATSKELQKMLGLTEMPVNNRLRQLKDAGLIKKTEANYYNWTELGRSFVFMIRKMQKDVITEMSKMV